MYLLENFQTVSIGLRGFLHRYFRIKKHSRGQAVILSSTVMMNIIMSMLLMTVMVTPGLPTMIMMITASMDKMMCKLKTRNMLLLATKAVLNATPAYLATPQTPKQMSRGPSERLCV